MNRDFEPIHPAVRVFVEMAGPGGLNYKPSQILEAVHVTQGFNEAVRVNDQSIVGLTDELKARGLARDQWDSLVISKYVSYLEEIARTVSWAQILRNRPRI